MNELLFENENERKSLENILAYNQIKKCDNEINKYTEEIELQQEEMKNILKNENVDEEIVEKILKYKSVLKNMCGDNCRISELDEIIDENEKRIEEFQQKISETELSMNELKEQIYNTENPEEVIDCQNQIENLNVRLNDLNDIINQLISDNTPLLIEREYLVAKNGDNDLNIPKYNKDEINKHLSLLEEEFKTAIEGLELPIRENIEFCQKKIKNRELEIEKFNKRKESVINQFPNSIEVDIEDEYNNITNLLTELELKKETSNENPIIFDDAIIEEDTTNEFEFDDTPAEISDFTDDMIDEMGDLEFEDKEEIDIVPAEQETPDETPTEEPIVEEKTVDNEEIKEVEEETNSETVEEKVESPNEESETTETEEVASVSYVLSEGESLSNIAEKVYPSKENWLAIYYFNKETIDKYLVSNGISSDIETIKELANDTNLFTGNKLENPTDYKYKI